MRIEQERSVKFRSVTFVAGILSSKRHGIIVAAFEHIQSS